MWNARSQAAYHGYSHLSGMEMMSPLNMWNHSALRTVRLAVADQRVRLVLLEPRVHVEEVVLLGPEHAGQRLPVDPSLVLAQRRRRDPVVELVGVGQARGDRGVEALAERLGRQRSADRRRRTTAEPPAGTSRM